MLLDHYSYSSYRLYGKCPRLFKLTKLGRVKPRETGAMSFGGYFHEEVEKYHKGKPYDKSTIKGYTDRFPKGFFDPDKVEVFFKEHLISTKTGEKIDIPFHGYIDGINDHGFFDLKVYQYPPEPYWLENNEQATLYLYINYLRTKKIVPFYYSVYIKPISAIKIYKAVRTINDFERLFLKMKEFDIMVKNDHFPCTCGKCHV